MPIQVNKRERVNLRNVLHHDKMNRVQKHSEYKNHKVGLISSDVEPVSVDMRLKPTVITLKGKCEVKYSDREIAKGLKFCSDSGSNSLLNAENVHGILVQAWTTGTRTAVMGVCHPVDKTFELKLPVYPGDPDIIKIQSYMDATDAESGIRKNFPLQMCGIHISSLKDNRVETQLCRDNFNPLVSTALAVRADVSHIPDNMLQRSALFDADETDNALGELNERIQTVLQTENLRPPAPAEGFVKGITYMPCAGVPDKGIPPIGGHYALLGAMMRSIDRTYPQALPVYCFMNAFTQSPHTVQDIELMVQDGNKNPQWVHLVASTVTGFTRDAGIVPYERDASLYDVVSLGLTGIQEHMILQTSEDINYLGYPAALATECDVDLSREEKPDITGLRACKSDKERMAFLHKAMFKREWPEMSRALGKDDCESSLMTCLIIENTIRKGDWSVEGVKRELQTGFTCFNQWTDGDFQMISKVFSKIQADLVCDNLQVGPVVGVAGGASATDVKAEDEQVMDRNDVDRSTQCGGHCFGALKAYDESTQKVKTLILEGTNSLHWLEENLTHKLKVPSRDAQRNIIPGKDMELPIDTSSLLSEISPFLSVKLQVCNVQNGLAEGQDAQPVAFAPGWKSGDLEHACMCRHALALAVQHPKFYQWCVYVCMTYRAASLGYLPCDAKPFLNSEQKAAGCGPNILHDENLQGIQIDYNMIQPATLNKLMAIYNEIYPPIAEKEVFVKVMNTWGTCLPLNSVNKYSHMPTMKRPVMHHILKADMPLADTKIKYETISAYETPASPLLTDVVFEAKSMVVNKYNELSTDGTFMTCTKGGTGVHVTLHVPLVEKTFDIINTVEKALEITGFKELCKVPSEKTR